MIYANTSFLLATYRESDVFHLPSIRLAARLQQPFALTLLVELELLNGAHRGLASRLLDRKAHDAILRQISDDEADGILVRRAIDQTELFARARDLSKKFTAEISARSLDILHVASAQILKIRPFVSFDAKQRLLAQRAGLGTLPKTLVR